MDLVHSAVNFAISMHRGQMYGAFPYIVHLSDVVKNLRRFHYDDLDYMAAGFLHDTIEDCGVTVNMLQLHFNGTVANLVDAVSGEGNNRRERKASMIEKLKAYPKAVPLKMADRLANITNCVNFNPRLLNMYEKEFDDYDLLFEAADREMNKEIRQMLGKGV